MNKKIYIASGLKNYRRVLAFRDVLEDLGIDLIYDWAEIYHQHSLKQEAGIIVDEDWETVAKNEYETVVGCDLLFVVTPGGRGTHFELGVAYANSKPIVILLENKEDMIAFYTLPGLTVCLTPDKAISVVLKKIESLGDYVAK